MAIDPTTSDTVVGVFDRERLSGALAATHQSGFGPHARVLDGARGDLAGQLRRAGIRIRLSLGPHHDAATALIVVTAPGRAPSVAETLTRAGARAIHGITRGAPTPFVASDAAQVPGPTGVIPPVRQEETDR